MDTEKFDETYMGLSTHFRGLLREAVGLERDFGIATVVAWRRVGKLSSDWQQKQALAMINTEETLRLHPLEVHRTRNPDSGPACRGVLRGAVSLAGDRPSSACDREGDLHRSGSAALIAEDLEPKL